MEEVKIESACGEAKASSACVANPLLLLGVLSFIVRMNCLFVLFVMSLKLDLLAIGSLDLRVI